MQERITCDSHAGMTGDTVCFTPACMNGVKAEVVWNLSRFNLRWGLCVLGFDFSILKCASAEDAYLHLEGSKQSEEM